jgi:hypothetical protein
MRAKAGSSWKEYLQKCNETMSRKPSHSTETDASGIEIAVFFTQTPGNAGTRRIVRPKRPMVGGSLAAGPRNICLGSEHSGLQSVEQSELNCFNHHLILL